MLNIILYVLGWIFYCIFFFNNYVIVLCSVCKGYNRLYLIYSIVFYIWYIFDLIVISCFLII